MSKYSEDNYTDELDVIDLQNTQNMQALGWDDEPERAKPARRKAAPPPPPKKRKRRSSSGGLIIFFIIFLVTLGAAGYTIWALYQRLQLESEARLAAEAELAEMKEAVAVAPVAAAPAAAPAVELTEDAAPTPSPAPVEPEEGKLYSYELVEDMLAAARTEAADEREQEIRDLIMYSATRDGGGPSTAVRSLITDYAFYSVTGGYEFQKLLDEVPRNDVDWDDLVKDEEDGSIRYMPGGVEHSWPMIDVSAFQKEIDWQAVADSGIKYAMIRSGFRGYSKGAMFDDDYIEQNLKGATEAGIKIGVYFFSEAITVEEAKEEAQSVLKLIAPYRIDLPVVIDIERITGDTARADQLDKDTRTTVSLAFLDEVAAAGYKPMIYCGIYTYFVQLDQSRIWQYPLWFPFYEEKFYFPYKVTCWQYRDDAKVPGIKGGVDMSIWLVDPESL
ncbi:MAG: glycoside hydrolase family 25 protein [Lachnospiraceae bacterium]|nr:glycoside hydrolase family 25 protein [Lachnospiraceae bacterium]